MVFGEVQKVSEDLAATIAPNRLQEGDLLVTRTGANFGQAAPWNDEVSDAHACADLLIVRNPRAPSRYLSTYFASREGRQLVLRGGYGGGQPHIAPSYLQIMPIPRFGALEPQIDSVNRQAAVRSREARDFLLSAQHSLESSLGLAGWVPPRPLAYPTSSRIARASARLDAEFFAPRIRGLISRLGSSAQTLGTVAPARHEKFDPTASETFEYIEIGDIGGDGRAESRTIDCMDAPSRATWHVHSGDVITSTVRPIRRLSALIEDHQDGNVCSSGFVVLQPVGVRPEVLLTYLRLPIFCELMDLHTSASMYPAISEKDLLSLPFAPPDPATETAVCTAVTNARRARSQAAALLSAAKRAVEIAIEEDEAAALRFLDEQEA